MLECRKNTSRFAMLVSIRWYMYKGTYDRLCQRKNESPELSFSFLSFLGITFEEGKTYICR